MRGVGIVGLMLLTTYQGQPAKAGVPPEPKVNQLTQIEGATPSPWFIDPATMGKVLCTNKSGAVVGTAVVIDSHHALTAKHVTSDRSCSLEGVAVTVSRDLAPDVVEITWVGPSANTRAIISCKGIIEGEDYYATGYAFNLPYVVTQHLIGSSSMTAGKAAAVKGPVSPGMSGGQVSDSEGRLVGITDAYTEGGIMLSFITPLKGTAICPSSNT